jgi:ATP-dependent helicase/nuclease subunit A
MSVDDPLQATDPRRDASVHASAGTGKTWLLVTRILRLLLAGACPDNLLAVTFTRKAAAEMEQRIMERLRELTEADEARRGELLQQAGVTPDAEQLARAAQLYETVLGGTRRLRCTTFHAFCQDLLARFPLEAGIAPGMEIRDTTGQLERAAYDALLVHSMRAPAAPLARALDALAIACDSLENAKRALYSFLAQRSDWWAWTDGEADPVAFATRSLGRRLEIDPADEPLAGYPDARQRERHQEFAALLRDNTATDVQLAARLDQALENTLSGEAFLAAATPAYLTGSGEPRKRKTSSAQQKRLGAGREARYLELHEQGCAEVLAASDVLARHRSLALNRAWYLAGHELLQHYQRIKQEQRVLDFADLEWQACRLLNRSEHASWVQYKLDARIDHLLVDEFQDTNPTQWRLLLPLLEELAAGDAGRERSVFLVGDRKQSIYRFRRANPALLETASTWLERQRAARRYRLDHSRRSAGAIMDCVNRVFTQPDMAGLLADFTAHGTYLETVYGHVELLPLCTDTTTGGTDPPAPLAGALRNPLHAPRVTQANGAFHEEGRRIAHTIGRLMADGTTVEKGDAVRPLRYDDIFILLRQRTHAVYYEQALRAAGIPCLGASRGLLLENLEVRDLVALLECLVSPYDNLALAQALRAPLFGLDSEQLLPLSGHDGSHWSARLAQLAQAGSAPWRDIHALLSHWRTLAGRLPVHDLLDRIFHEGELLQRYERAFPESLHPRVQASFTRFIELALELDNGRYPSLPRFLGLLQRLRESDQDQPDESAPDDSHGQRVRLMTVHGAKGLEAPVVFLADAATEPKDHSAWSGCVDWPDGAERPRLMLLAARKTLRDRCTRSLLEAQAVAARREEANLLYVALTRARQYLYISGSTGPRNGGTGWYGLLEAALADCHGTLSTGIRKAPHALPVRDATAPEVDPALSRPVQIVPRELPIAPSRLSPAGAHHHADPDGRERGIAIHLMLERLAGNPESSADVLYRAITNRLQRTAEDAELQAWWEEARAIVAAPSLAALYDAAQYTQAFNEAPVQYLDGTRMVYGVIDRLVLHGGNVLVIDYKTHRHATRESAPQLAQEYRAQLACYAQAAARLWPGRTVRPAVLFTACTELVWLDEVESRA